MFDLTLIVLKCVCKECGALLFDANDPNELKKIAYLEGVSRLRMVARLSGLLCRTRTSASAPNVVYGCGARQPRVGRFMGIYPGLQIKATL